MVRPFGFLTNRFRRFRGLPRGRREPRAPVVDGGGGGNGIPAAVVLGGQDDDEDCSPEHRFMVALQNSVDPVPELLGLVREYGGNGALFWKFCRRPEGILYAACFERLTTDQLMALFGPLVEENPELRYSEGVLGECLLRMAVRRRADLRVILLLLNPELELQKSELDGSTLLHLACRYGNEPAVEYLLDRHPKMAAEADGRGNLPLHWACRSYPLLEPTLLLRLVDLHPPALRRRNMEGHTPITMAFCRERPVAACDLRSNAQYARLLQLEPEAVRMLPEVLQSKCPTALSGACQRVRSENLVHLLIRAWPVALGLLCHHERGRRRLPFEDLRLPVVITGTDTDTPSSTPELVRLVDGATQRLMLALVELAWHETVREDVATSVRLPLEPTIRSLFPAAGHASLSSTNSHSLARAIRRQGCPMELCRYAFHLESVQRLLFNDEPVRDALCGLYRLHEWEDHDEVERRHRLKAVSGVVAEEVVGDPFDGRGLVQDNLDCLFLWLRESPSLFASA